jgi:biopolymer transport protein ExbB
MFAALDLTWAKVFKVWTDGGWCMIPLAMISLVIYAVGIQLVRYFRGSDLTRVPEEVWAKWIEEPAMAEGEVGDIIQHTQRNAATLQDVRNRFEEVQAAIIPRINRRMMILNVLVTAAPLLGLLGTVLGMIKTFEGIAGSGVGRTGDMVASGISQALVTTEVGLLIAVPGYVFAYLVRAKRDEHEVILAKLETATLQVFEKKQRGASA